MWPFTPKTLYDRYSKLMRLIMSIDSHFEVTENEEDSVRLHLPNYKGNQPMDFHIYLMEPFLFISFVTEVEGEKISVVNSYPQDMDQQDMFNAAMASNMERVHNALGPIIEKEDCQEEGIVEHEEKQNNNWSLNNAVQNNKRFKDSKEKAFSKIELPTSKNIYLEAYLIHNKIVNAHKLNIETPNGTFGIMDVRIDDGNWRIRQSYHNIIEGQKFNISDIKAIEYDIDTDVVKLAFNKVLKEGLNAIWFNRQYGKICISFYNQRELVKSFDSEYDKAHTTLEKLYEALCALARLKGNYAIITLNGGVFQVDYIQNYYDEKVIRNSINIEVDESLSEEVDSFINSNLQICVDQTEHTTVEGKKSIWKDKMNAEYSDDRKRLMHVPGEIKDYTVLDGTEEIEDYAFANFDGEDIEYSEIIQSGRNIEECIHSTSELVSVTIPSSVNRIGKGILDRCDKLVVISIPKGTKEKFVTMLPDYEDILIEGDISTAAHVEDLENAWIDESGVKYSVDKRKLLKAPSGITKYAILPGTKIIGADENFRGSLSQA